MTFKKVIRTIHLWLGLISGPVVFIIAITGCIYVFQEEIQDITQPYRFVSVPDENKGLLPPSTIKSIAEEALPGKVAQRIYYEETNRAAFVRFMASDYYYLVYINPFSGQVLKVKNMYQDFFYNVFRLHVHLLLPPDIGKKITSISTLIFLVLLFSGLFLWWPKKKKKRKSGFVVKTNGSKKRFNYDLHNVLGFYITWIVIFSAVTGLVWGFQWFSESTYWLTSGGRAKPAIDMPISSGTIGELTYNSSLDSAFSITLAKYPERQGYMLFLPQSETGSIGIAANPEKSTFYKMDYLYFDQQTLKELQRPVYGKYEDAGIADKALRMNYDIHVGSIGGLAGKLILFFTSLITASLPVTGFLIWYRKKRKKPKTAVISHKRRILNYTR